MSHRLYFTQSFNVCSLSRRCHPHPVRSIYLSSPHRANSRCSSHLRTSIWFSSNLLLTHPDVYVTVLVPPPSISKCEEHISVFFGENTNKSLSIKSRLRFLPVGAVDGADAQDRSGWLFSAMAKGLPGVLSEILSASPSADGFLRRPSLSFVDVTISYCRFILDN